MGITNAGARHIQQRRYDLTLIHPYIAVWIRGSVAMYFQ